MPDMTELEQFSEEFFQDILQESENGGWKEDFFFSTGSPTTLLTLESSVKPSALVISPLMVSFASTDIAAIPLKAVLRETLTNH